MVFHGVVGQGGICNVGCCCVVVAVTVLDTAEARGCVVVGVLADSFNITFNGGIQNTERMRKVAKITTDFPLRAIHRWVDSSMLPWR